MRSTILACVAAVALACTGADGATGPTGPQGPQGPVGPAGTAHIFTGIITSAGSVTVSFPAAAGADPTSPPATTCFVAQTPASGVWLSVNQTTSSNGTCGLVFSAGHWTGSLLQVPVGWTAAFVVIY
jgi:hypothetical protein